MKSRIELEDKYEITKQAQEKLEKFMEMAQSRIIKYICEQAKSKGTKTITGEYVAIARESILSAIDQEYFGYLYKLEFEERTAFLEREKEYKLEREQLEKEYKRRMQQRHYYQLVDELKDFV